MCKLWYMAATGLSEGRRGSILQVELKIFITKYLMLSPADTK